jgi:hypothetical protein
VEEVLNTSLRLSVFSFRFLLGSKIHADRNNNDDTRQEDDVVRVLKTDAYDSSDDVRV